MDQVETTNYWNFSLAVVRHPDGRFLIVQETQKHQFLWWLPGGRVEHGDSWVNTATKETLEEGGLAIVPTHLLRVEQGGGRMRFIYLAVPADNPPPTQPKTVADSESTQSIWTGYTDADYQKPPINGKLRGDEPVLWFSYVGDSLGPLYPLHLTEEIEPKNLTPQELTMKAKSAEQRLPHMTIAQTEVLVFTKIGRKTHILLTNNKFPIYKVDSRKHVKWNKSARVTIENETGLQIEVVGVLKIRNEAAVHKPHAKVLFTYVATCKHAIPSSPAYSFVPKLRCLTELATREKGLLTRCWEKEGISPMSLIALEGQAPQPDDIQKAVADVEAFKQMYTKKKL